MQAQRPTVAAQARKGLEVDLDLPAMTLLETCCKGRIILHTWTSIVPWLQLHPEL